MPDTRPTLLIVEDDEGLQTQLKWCLDDYKICSAANRTEAIAQLRRFEPQVVLQDLGLPPQAAGVAEGLASIQEILALSPATKIIVLTGNEDRNNAIKAVGVGAFDYCQKPIDSDALKMAVARAFKMHALEQDNLRLRATEARNTLQGIVSTDESMFQVCRMIEKVAPADVSVLITGESGTGKELLARAVHMLSSKRNERFVAINCAAIPEQLLESELFGHEKGSFTGAYKQSIGKIESANGGTLFLDEIGDMPLQLQAKLLRFLQDRVIERIGGRVEIPIDVRIVCATNQDLSRMISEQRFRQDLYYRIGAVCISVPPLRERRGGIAVLAHALLNRFNDASGKPALQLSSEADAAIENYSWPGNVRELENKLKTAMIMAESNLIRAADLGLSSANEPVAHLNLSEIRSNAERGAVSKALISADWNVSRAAELLGISRPTIYDLITKYELRSTRD